MLNLADFDEAYNNKPNNVEEIPCQAPACFVGSYAPVARPGEDGKFETVGTVKVRSSDLEKCKK